ncbi:MAG: hypothetical protein AAF941_07280 [Pseudomonadota bacterium]
MNKMMIVLAGSALTTGLVATSIVAPAPVEAAGPFDKIKKGLKKVKKKKREADEVVGTVDAVITGGAVASGVGASADGSRCNANRGSNSNSPCTARAPGHTGSAAPAPAKFTSQLKCANVGLGNAFIGRDGNYTFSQGISTEERSGLLDRVNVQPTNGCFFPGLGVGDVLYVEFDKSKYKKYDYKIQCVSYDGKEQLDNVNGPSVGNFGGKAIMLHTGNSTGYEPTASGSNSDRSNAYKAYMDKRGRTFTTFNFSALHTDKAGTDFFCQWFDKSNGKSALALTFRRGPAG